MVVPCYETSEGRKNADMKNSEVIKVALAFDEGFAVHGATAIQSILANRAVEDKLHICVIDIGLSPDSRQKLEQLVTPSAELTLLHPSFEFFEGLPTTNHHFSTYARMAIGELLPDIKKILYLDSDLVVVDSLATLWNTDVSDFVAGVVPDSMSLFRGTAMEYWRSIGLPETATYFSAGVMLLNLDAWREEAILQRSREWIETNALRMAHSDQSALNAVLHDRVRLLDLRWNLQTPLIPPVKYGWGCTQEMHDAVQSPAIVHYVTGRKPWKQQYRVPMADLYWKYRFTLDWDFVAGSFSTSEFTSRCREESIHIARSLRAAVRRIAGRIPAPV